MTNAVSLAQIGSNNTTFRNRLINPAMVIDQRNAGASLTPSATGAGTYTVDRWQLYITQASKITMQQNAGSVTPPAGFSNYLGATVASAYTVTSSDLFLINQFIEGFNIADLAWGTSNAKSVTLSFWVYSSLTGTFGGSLTNSGNTRTYPFTYTVSTANTWTQISINVAGDTAGTWVTNNGTGLGVRFSLGTGSTYLGTAGAWSGSSYFGATGQTQWVGTSGATFYITGVQLEAGSAATPFEYRSYGTELQLCQRYYAFLGNTNYYQYTSGAQVQSGSNAYSLLNTPVTMRSGPALTITGVTNFILQDGSTSASPTGTSLDISSPNTVGINWTVSGLTTGRAMRIYQNASNSTSIQFSSEL